MSGQARRGRLAILSGGGSLPVTLAAAEPDALVVTFAGQPSDHAGPTREHRLERLGDLVADMRAEGVKRVVMAGAMHRPRFDPAALDAFTRGRLDRIEAAMRAGDDAVLRFFVDLFESEGFAVEGAEAILQGLTPAPGLWAGPEPDAVARADIARGREILAALSPLDLGQATVVAGGLCLGIETVQGTDALLDFVARTDPARRPSAPGVLVKRPKRGQELRVDLPAIGPQTVRAAHAAGLAGIAVAAGRTLILDQDETRRLLEQWGLFLLAEGDERGADA